MPENSSFFGNVDWAQGQCKGASTCSHHRSLFSLTEISSNAWWRASKKCDKYSKSIYFYALLLSRWESTIEIWDMYIYPRQWFKEGGCVKMYSQWRSALISPWEWAPPPPHTHTHTKTHKYEVKTTYIGSCVYQNLVYSVVWAAGPEHFSTSAGCVFSWTDVFRLITMKGAQEPAASSDELEPRFEYFEGWLWNSTRAYFRPGHNIQRSVANFEPGFENFSPGVEYSEAGLENLERRYEKFEPGLETFATDGTAYGRFHGLSWTPPLFVTAETEDASTENLDTSGYS